MTNVTPLALAEVLLITPQRRGDARGWFAETWSRKDLLEKGVDTQFVQDNQAFNAKKGTVRGLHFQRAPHAQGKLVRVLKGAIFDVAVDVRPGSATYGQWAGATLTAEFGEQLWVPRGFAHGYMTIADDTELFYKVDNDYAPELEGGLMWNDPDIGIAWPLDLADPLLSERDKALPRLKDMPKAEF